jgi:hypothetical protein
MCMERVDGIEASRQLTECCGPPALALTTFNYDELLSGVLPVGAAVFVLNGSPAEELIRLARPRRLGRLRLRTPHHCLVVRGPAGYGNTVCINITSYADHSDRLKYRSRPDDQGWIIGA